MRTVFFKTLDAKAVIMTLPDLDNYYIKRSNKNIKYFYVFHSVFSTHRIYNEKAFDNYDVIMCAGEHHLQEIRRRENLFGLKKVLQKYGYPKIDVLSEKFKKLSFSKLDKKVLIAPGWTDSSITRTCLFELVDILLEQAFHITIRFHSMSYIKDKEIVKKIKKLSNINKLINVDNSEDSLKTLKNNFIMISDWSGVAIEFAFSKNMPVILIDTVPKKINKNWNLLKLGCIEDNLRNEIGYTIKKNNLKDVVHLIHKIKNEKDLSEWKIKINKIRQKTLYNTGSSAKVGSKIILENLKKNL